MGACSGKAPVDPVAQSEEVSCAADTLATQHSQPVLLGTPAQEVESIVDAKPFTIGAQTPATNACVAETPIVASVVSVGMKVQVKPSLSELCYGWGDVTHESV